MKPLLALAALPLVLGACALPPAPANTAAPATAAKGQAAALPDDKGDEVTGSRIRRKDTQGVANVSREEFEAARQAAGNVAPRGN